MFELRARESVILAEHYATLVDWYVNTLGLRITQQHSDGYHYTQLEGGAGLRIGIADAKEMGTEITDRHANTVILQFEVDDVAALVERVRSTGGGIDHGPAQDPAGFWCGAFTDPEGNPLWVVDRSCPVPSADSEDAP